MDEDANKFPSILDTALHKEDLGKGLGGISGTKGRRVKGLGRWYCLFWLADSVILKIPLFSTPKTST